eukprot:3305436-Heterocapsa_arctica.AAC.1
MSPAAWLASQPDRAIEEPAGARLVSVAPLATPRPIIHHPTSSGSTDLSALPGSRTEYETLVTSIFGDDGGSLMAVRRRLGDAVAALGLSNWDEGSLLTGSDGRIIRNQCLYLALA